MTSKVISRSEYGTGGSYTPITFTWTADRLIKARRYLLGAGRVEEARLVGEDIVGVVTALKGMGVNYQIA
jgi:hypothetical protein